MPESTLRLFFALRPPPQAQRQIAATAAALNPTARTRWLKPAHYHVTVHFLGSHPGEFPSGLLDCAQRAADSVRMAPFQIVLDRLDSFRTREQAPLILRPDAPSEAALQAFWQRLAAALMKNGQRHHIERAYTPHLTIGYGAALPAAAIAPITWNAAEFELIVSHAGEGRHETLARWPLMAGS